MKPTNDYVRTAKSQVEVADILRSHIGDYLKKYKMPPEHYRVVYDILNCRTAYLGGHMEMCDQCGNERIMYNSCRNRHCPKCQALTKQRWLAARHAELLPIKYFHNVFTLPHELNPLILCNKPLMLGFLFQSVSQTLIQFGKNPDNGLGGQLGMIAILHTWTQTLMDHFHLHCLVPGGAITNDRNAWIDAKGKFLFPVKALSKVFRGKFISLMEDAYRQGRLHFPGNTSSLGTRKGFRHLIKQLWSKNWVVYTKPSIDRPEWVLDYLGRYTHRIAISNHRITDFSGGRVTFTIKNRKNKTTETVTLDAVEFIRRFLLHVLPKRFVRIRHYGFLANRDKKKNIGLCRLLMKLPPDIPVVEHQTVQEIMLTQTGIDISKCPCCKTGTMRKIYDIPEGAGENSFSILKPAGVRNKAAP